MRFLYATDLHGAIWKYEHLAKRARQLGVKLILIGGDLLPNIRPEDSGREVWFNHYDYLRARFFILRYLDRYFGKLAKFGVQLRYILGNDDPPCLEELFTQLLVKHQHIVDINSKVVSVGDYELVGMNLVVEHPFRRDRCRGDVDRTPRIKTKESRFLSGLPIFTEIKDWPGYLSERQSLAEELEGLPKPKKMSRAIYVIHQPPAGMGLATIRTGFRPPQYQDRLVDLGSMAVTDFIHKRHPLLTLHGHIHQSPEHTGVWLKKGGRTTVIQPGQHDASSFVYVVGDLQKMIFRRSVAAHPCLKKRR